MPWSVSPTTLPVNFRSLFVGLVLHGDEDGELAVGVFDEVAERTLPNRPTKLACSWVSLRRCTSSHDGYGAVDALNGEIPAAEDRVGEPGRVVLARRERHGDDEDEEGGDEQRRREEYERFMAHIITALWWAARPLKRGSHRISIGALQDPLAVSAADVQPEVLRPLARISES